MDDATAVKVFSGARIAIGALLVLSPRRLAGLWLGADTDRPPVRAVVRSMGARDAVIGAGGLLAANRGAPTRGWLEAGAVSDAADMVASLMAGRSLPATGRFAMPVFAALGAATGVYLARSGRKPGPVSTATAPGA